MGNRGVDTWGIGCSFQIYPTAHFLIDKVEHYLIGLPPVLVNIFQGVSIQSNANSRSEQFGAVLRA